MKAKCSDRWFIKFLNNNSKIWIIYKNEYGIYEPVHMNWNEIKEQELSIDFDIFASWKQALNACSFLNTHYLF